MEKKYYTQDTLNRIAAMTDNEMRNALSDAIDSPMWIALLKYVNLRSNTLLYTMRAADPIKDPVRIARTQGGITGMEDVADAMYQIWESKHPPEVAADSPDHDQSEFRPYDFGGGYDDQSPEN